MTTAAFRVPAALLLAASVAAFAPALRAQAPGAKVGVVDSQRVLEASAAGKRVLAQLAERDKALRDGLEKLDSEIRQLETRLAAQGVGLSASAAADLNAQLAAKRTERQRRGEDATKEMQDLQFRLFNRVQGELIPVIQKLGQERGLDLILDLAKSGAVWLQPAVDLTPEVIRRYDAGAPAPAAAPAKK